MSGIEVAGLILGAIPLIIEGFKRSQMAFAAFDTYRHYPKELTKLDAKISAQKTVFRNNCINLLFTITKDRPKVDAMLMEVSHAAWQDAALHNTLATQIEALNESFTSCQRTMEQIDYALQNICREMEAFQTILSVNSEQESGSIGNREWYRRLGKRVKLSLNKPKIETHIDELRSFNSDFNLMSNQIISSLKDTTTRDLTSHTHIPQAETRSSLFEYQSVRKASQRVYETLENRWSCSLHSNHSANISCSLDETLMTSELKAENMSIVRLKMAITYFAETSSGDIPIWLEIESGMDVSLVYRTLPALHDMSTTLQSGTGVFVREPQTSLTKKIVSKKKVRFDQNLSQSLQSLSVQAQQSHMDRSLDESMLNLCLIKDVCEHFQKHQGHSQQQLCVGYVNDTCIQRFYQPPPEKRLSGKTKSLEDIIVWVSEDPIRIIPRSIMIQLAASLAAAVLQYHSTPWLSDLWRSKDIVFFGIDDFQQGMISLRFPHLNVDFARSEWKKNVSTDGETPVNTPSHIDVRHSRDSMIQGARNRVLFCLGIVLLEVGFATPWTTLRASMLKTLSDNCTSDYTIADKLARLLVNSMGPNFSRIVRKCLGCDFGLGETDLSSEELQGKFLSDVVSALKGLEERFPVA